MSERWMTIIEFARENDVSDMTIRRRIKNGKLHAIMKDGKYFIPTKNPTHVNKPRRTDYSDQVMKAHPSAQNTIDRNNTSQNNTLNNLPDSFSANEYATKVLPSNLVNNLRQNETSLVESKALLAFCEASIKKFGESEKKQVEKFKAKLVAVETELDKKNIIISNLSTQIEDLQLLVKMLESKS